MLPAAGEPRPPRIARSGPPRAPKTPPTGATRHPPPFPLIPLASIELARRDTAGAELLCRRPWPSAYLQGSKTPRDLFAWVQNFPRVYLQKAPFLSCEL